MRTSPLAFLVAVVITGSSDAPPACAGDTLPGEKTELTPEVRAEAEQHLAAIRDGKDVEKARTALLRMGPVVWPAVENAIRLTITDAPKPHLNYLKALLAAKAEPEFEWLRGRLRRAVLIGKNESILTELNGFRLGAPDPKSPSKRLPFKCPSTPLPGGGLSYRSGDGSIYLAFGQDALPPRDPKKEVRPDGGDVLAQDEAAGFVAAIGGKAVSAPRMSGKGGNAVARAPRGFAFAWAQDGAKGLAPGGSGGEGGASEATGGAGKFARPGNGGASADG
jgi:hypothetical protein